jgi:hypothetical protein
MEKPVRIVGNEKIRSFNEKVRNGLEHALNFMLGSEEPNKITIGGFEPFLMPIETYIAAYKKKSILVKLHSQKAYEGELYWFFEMKTAVVLGGMLRLLPPSSLQEKVQEGTFDATDQDAFGEVGNQLSGILDRAFRTLTSKDIHLKMDFNKKVYPDEAIKVESFLNKEEYVVLLCSITIPSQGSQKLTLLLPHRLYEVLLNLEIQLEGITPKIVLVHSWDPERIEKIQMQMNSRYTKVVPVEKVDDILSRLDTPNLAAVGLDLKSLSFPLALQESILLKRFLANRNFTRLPYFLSWGNPSEASVAELAKMGLAGATKAPLVEQFPKWAHAFTKDPSKSY